MSKVFKGVGKAFKGIGKAVKGIVNGVKKVFKKVWNSKLGKALIIAGVIFITGGLAGVWATPFASVNSIGASVKAATWGANAAATGGVNTAAINKSLEGFSLAGTGGATATGGVNTAAINKSLEGFSLAGTGGATATGGVNTATINQSLSNISPGGGFSLAGTTASGLPPTVPTPEVPAPSILGNIAQGAVKAGKAVYDWSNRNPLLAATALNAGASALSPDELDLIREQEKLRNERYRRAYYNDDGVSIFDPDFGFGAGYVVRQKPRAGT